MPAFSSAFSSAFDALVGDLDAALPCAVTPAIVDLDVGDQWRIVVTVPSGSVVAVAVTAPDGAVTNPEPQDGAGEITVIVPTTLPGRYLAVITVTGPVAGVVPFVANASLPSAAGDLPDLTEVRAYLDTNGGTSATDASIQEALDAETDAQRRHCYVPAVYPYDLREALKRRVARNLAARAVPLAQVTSFEGATVQTRVPRLDAEVARLEGPHRKTFLL
jgi:hypothetical protein